MNGRPQTRGNSKCVDVRPHRKQAVWGGQERSLGLVCCHMPGVSAFRRRKQETVLGHTVRLCLKRGEGGGGGGEGGGRKAGRGERKISFGAGTQNIE